MSDNSETSTYDRRLVAIMFTDIVGYTSMMEMDENVAVEIIENHRKILEKYRKNTPGRGAPILWRWQP
jgi:class 3 adenylate cyclase